MDRGNEVFLTAMISLTANQEWDVFVKDLEQDVYNKQADLLDTAKNWDQVVFAKGWTSCLAYIMNLRDRTKIELENVTADV